MRPVRLRQPSAFSPSTVPFAVLAFAVVIASILTSAILGPSPCRAEQGFRLDDRSERYQVPSGKTLDLTEAVTLEAWVKAGKMSSAGGRILDKSVPGTQDGYMLDTFPGNSLRLLNSTGMCRYDAQLPADRWTHVVGVFSRLEGIMKLYVQGKEVASIGGPFLPMRTSDVPLCIGADPNGGNRFHGHIRRAAVYGRALSAEEILERAVTSEPKPLSRGGVLGEWVFAEKPGRKIESLVGALSLQVSGLDLNTVFHGGLTGEAPAPKGPLSLWYRQPAQQWVEALAVGNGRLGAMVFGGIDNERLQLNEDTLWAGGPYDPSDPGALEALPEARRRILAGEYKEAHQWIGERMMANPLRQMPYQPVGNLLLSFPELDSAEDYRRDLNLDTAIASVSFTANGVRYAREVFVSPVDQVIAVRLTADQPGKISFGVGWQTPQQATVVVEQPDTLVLNGKNGTAQGVDGALRFQARLQMMAEGGRLSSDEDRLDVQDADAVTLLIAVATSYRSYRDVSGDPEALTREALATAGKKTISTLRDDHIAEHRRLFRRVSLDLGTTEAAFRPTDERIRDFAAGNDPHLAAMYFQFGRYLLISSSRPGCQPANLQGIWNESTKPPWDSKYTININTEMNYWPAEPANLAECVDPLTQMVLDLAETGARTARINWGAGGWVCHHNTDLWRASAPIDGPSWGFWPLGGAWLCQHLWDHFEYGGDREYLQRVYPAMKGAAQFFLDTLIEDPKKGWLVTCPSLSPENPHPHGVAVCAGPAMDMQILRDLFQNCIRAAEVLDVDPEFRQRLAETRSRLAPDQIGKAGQLQEWLEDWDMEAPQIHHRHVSHLYALYPSNQINVHETPKLAAAVRKSLEIRGDNATGWGIGWRLNLWARLHEADHAHDILKMLIAPQRTYPNMFDAHPPFQIDGNFGGTSGIAEMLLQSRRTLVADLESQRPVYEIELLPALPSAWPAGSVKGLRARGGFEVDLDWQDGQLVSASVRSRSDSRLRIRYRGETREYSAAKDGAVRWYTGVPHP